ncbi:hypothetical protein F5883DRAFT_573942, partial [Diaporthe sp. PMI_573]
KYSQCLRYQGKRIADVRLHLRRTHRQPAYCPRCGCVFNDSDSLGEHLRTKDCEAVVPKPEPPGITPEQEKLMNDLSSNRQISLSTRSSGRWYHIWDIIFPQSPQPESPYAIENPIVQKLLDVQGELFSSKKWEELIPESSRHLLEAMDPLPRQVFIRGIVDRFITMVGTHDDTGARDQTRSDRKSHESSAEHTPSWPNHQAFATGELQPDHRPLTTKMPNPADFQDESPLLLSEGPLAVAPQSKGVTVLPTRSKTPVYGEFSLRG